MGNSEQNREKNLELDAQHYAPCTLNCMYICILLLVTLKLLLWTILYDCNIVYSCEWTFMNISNILTSKKYFSFVFRYSKRTCPVILECTQHHSITIPSLVQQCTGSASTPVSLWWAASLQLGISIVHEWWTEYHLSVGCDRSLGGIHFLQICLETAQRTLILWMGGVILGFISFILILSRSLHFVSHSITSLARRSCKPFLDAFDRLRLQFSSIILKAAPTGRSGMWCTILCAFNVKPGHPNSGLHLTCKSRVPYCGISIPL